MNRKTARAIVGNRPKWELRVMAQALQMSTWHNNANDWQRLAALRALGYKVTVTIPEGN